jgi:RHS repeat-associated protein
LTNSLGLGSSGDTITTTYDPTDTPSLVALKNATSTLQSFTYSDAPAGTILSETDTPAAPASPATYTYTAQGRVASMKPGTGTTLSYGFDPSGNLTTLPTGAAGTYDHDSELTSAVLSAATTSYSYNADGERLGESQGGTATTSASWNGAGQVTAYSNTAANMTAATYDGNGYRATATTSAGTQTFTWNLVSAVPQLIMDAKNAYIYAGGTTPAEQVSLAAGTITYLSADALGSVRGTVSAAGALTGTTSYDAWGNPATAGGLTASTPFGYAGGYTDPDGLSYLLNRYYDPAAGAFISVDPAISQTYEPYAYAGDNPVSRTDPTGLAWWTYETIHKLSRISQDNYYNESPSMAGAMEKVTAEVVAKKIDTIARWLIALGAVIGLVVRSHPQVSQIITAVGAVVAIISGKRIVALIKWVKGWVYKGRHAGLYVTDFSAETSPPNRYVGTTIRRCAASTVSCGSPADHGKEYWP